MIPTLLAVALPLAALPQSPTYAVNAFDGQFSLAVWKGNKKTDQLTGGYRAFQYVPSWHGIAAIRSYDLYRWIPGKAPEHVFSIPKTRDLRRLNSFEHGLPQLEQTAFALSPGADRLAFTYYDGQKWRLEVYDLGSRKRKLFVSQRLGKSDGSWLPDVGITWSRDGSRIAFAVPGPSSGTTDGMADPRCVVVSLSGKTIRTFCGLPYGWVNSSQLVFGQITDRCKYSPAVMGLSNGKVRRYSVTCDAASWDGHALWLFDQDQEGRCIEIPRGGVKVLPYKLTLPDAWQSNMAFLPVMVPERGI